ncbi:MAG: DUF4198 domain-containing protein [Pirellulaceae bacterium]
MFKPMFKQTAAGMVILLATAVSASGHDYWLQPQRFFLAKGESTAVKLFVGDHFVSETDRPVQSKKTVDFQLISRNEMTDLRVTKDNGARTSAFISPKNLGSHLVVMQRDWSHIEIEAAKFNKYLEHEGLSRILELRRKAGEEKTVGRERYRRYLKALVQVGKESDETFKRKIGHRLEILPHSHPSATTIGDDISLSILFEGKPLINAQVAAYNRRDDQTKTHEARTDEQGRVQFTLDHSGLWLIRLVHMQRCDDDPEFEWESFWAAYSFQLK